MDNDDPGRTRIRDNLARLNQGGDAADAYLAAALRQTVVEPDALHLPRFALPSPDGTTVFERHYQPPVFTMLDERGIRYRRSPAIPATGLVGAIVIDADGTLHVTQDPRRAGLARAE